MKLWQNTLFLVTPFMCAILQCSTQSNTFYSHQSLARLLKSSDPLSNFDPFHILRGLSIDSEGYPDINAEANSDVFIPMDTALQSKLLEVYRKNKVLFDDLMLELGYDVPMITEHDNRDILNILVHLFAPITPLLGVNETCLEQSVAYIDRLIVPDIEAVWAHYMLDSTGKVPDGFVADTVEMCDILDFMSHQECTKYPLLGLYLDNITIPRGNAIAMGSFPGCINVEAIHTKPNQIWQEFTGQHCYFRLKYNPSTNDQDWLVQESDEHNQWEDALQFNPMRPKMPYFPPMFGFNSTSNTTSLVAAIKFTYVLFSGIRWGACIPSGCSMDEAVNNYNILYEPYELGVTPKYCETTETQEKISELNAASYIAIVVFSIIAFCMLCGTLIEIYQNLSPVHKAMTNEELTNYDPFWIKVFKCFSIYTNGRKVLNSNTGAGNSHLGCLSGIRVFSMLWVVVGHVFITGIFAQLQNPQYVTELYTGKNASVGWETLFNALPSVDSFFFLSGLLVAYLSFIEMEKGRFNLPMFYIHRYIRLTIPLALAILFEVGLTYQLGHGPFWHTVDNTVVEHCKKHWWTNLLYINNLIYYDSQCLGQTWYLACDMQFFWYSPILLIPMYKFQKKGYWGMKWWFLNLVIYTVVPIALTVKYNLPPTTMIYSVNTVQDDFDMNGEFYVRPYTRFQPYLIGMGLGFLLYKLKDKEIKMHWLTNVLGWLCAIATGLGVIYGLYHIRTTNKYYEPSYSMFESAMYNGFHRLAWPLALAWVVFACVKGYGGFINSFLSWGLFLSFGRLTYMIYLIHIDVIFGFFTSLSYSMQYTPIIMSYICISLAAISTGLAFVGTLTMEAPFISLEKLLLGRLLGRPTPTKKPFIDEAKDIQEHIEDSSQEGSSDDEIQDYEEKMAPREEEAPAEKSDVS